MTREQIKSVLIMEFGREAYEEARLLASLSDPDGAWALAMDAGREDVAEIIEELYFD